MNSSTNKYIDSESQTDIVCTRNYDENLNSQVYVESSRYKVKSSQDRVIRGEITNSKNNIWRPGQNYDFQMLNARFIQRFWRGVLCKRQAYIRRSLPNEIERTAHEKKAKKIHRRFHPNCRLDFKLLYSEVVIWRKQEFDKIEKLKLPSKKRTSMQSDILMKETKLLRKIGSLHKDASEKNRKQRVTSSLEKLAEPKHWKLSNGNVIKVQTPSTNRAEELRILFQNLTETESTVNRRLKTLTAVKYRANDFDCSLTRDICELIDREIDMLNRGRGGCALGGLRKRLSNLFLQFVENPEFNLQRVNIGGALK